MNFEINEKSRVSPELSGLEKWVDGIVIKIFKNPFLGEEVAIKDDQGRIFYGEKKYFKK